MSPARPGPTQASRAVFRGGRLRQKPAPASPPPRSPSLSVSARQRRSSLPPAARACSQPRGGRTHVAPSCWSRLRSPGADAALALSPWPPRPAPPAPGPRQMLGMSERDTASGTLSRGLCPARGRGRGLRRNPRSHWPARRWGAHRGPAMPVTRGVILT